VIDRVEACDDGAGNAAVPGACRPDCVLPSCDDGIVDPGEVCLGRAVLLDDSVWRSEDIDGDGDEEIQSTGRPTRLLEHRNGRWVRAWTGDPLAAETRFHDVDRDGVTDVIEVYTASITWARGSGDFRFRELASFPLDIAAPEYVLAADLRDRIVVAAPNEAGAVRIYALAGGAPMDLGTVDLPAGPRYWRTALFRDVDGDDTSELLVAADEWLHRITLGEPASVRPWLDLRTGSFALAEIDGVPPIDLVVEQSAGFQAYENRRGELAVRPPFLRLGEDHATGDVDLDGIDELIETRGRHAWIRRLPGGDVAGEIDAPFEISYPDVSCDADGDGARDLMLRGRRGVEVHFVRPGGLAPPFEWAIDSFALGCVEADRDGALDMVQSFFESSVQLGRHQSAARMWPIELEVDRLLVTGPDLLALNDGGRLSRLPIRDGAPGPEIPLLEEVDAFDVIDADGDRIDDVAFAGPDVGIARGLADGTLQRPVATASVSGPVLALEAGDIGGDGEIDVIVRSADALHVFVGPSMARAGRVALASPLASFTLADADQDGALDVVTLDGRRLAVYAGDGLALAFERETPGTRSLAVADFDGDGAPDAATTDELSIFYYDGIRGAARAQEGSLFRPELHAADLDGDGTPELLSIGAGAATHVVTVLRPSADGLAMIRGFALPRATHALAPVDADGDGALDLILSLAPSLDDFFFDDAPPELAIYYAHP
jgi:hypothetical protein